VRILIVEDEPKVAQLVKKGLEAENFSADVAADGIEALESAAREHYDLVVLDLMLPKLDGLDVLTQWRKNGMSAPVLVLTARTSVAERVKGLESGADDYLVKPFSFEELLARIRVLLRRPTGAANELRVGDLVVNRIRREVTRRGKTIALTPKEYAVLEYLVLNAGRPVTRAMLLEHVWKAGLDGMTNIVDVYINFLRAKLDQGFETRLIRTVRGVGYMVGEPGLS